MTTPTPILIGSTFPPSLIRARVVIEPRPLDELKAQLATRPIASFWGHDNTLVVANQILNADLTPATKRPAITLSANQRPVLNGNEFHECWILSPDYTPGFRPHIGEEVSTDTIIGWQVLRMQWT
ncbi:MAG TPA: hypothetical protein PKE26_05210 [Kiritimatiellia bacterium]|nr:hypothetical protein [Kiritimatiellia bacterium]HMO98491.1 hypothetical protein [Kiritimatiellia bacterium]HMP95799.1 hypothetical protein [Kiritimatiellia bacterium]